MLDVIESWKLPSACPLQVHTYHITSLTIAVGQDILSTNHEKKLIQMFDFPFSKFLLLTKSLKDYHDLPICVGIFNVVLFKSWPELILVCGFTYLIQAVKNSSKISVQPSS
jgi:hypothetical protein